VLVSSRTGLIVPRPYPVQPQLRSVWLLAPVCGGLCQQRARETSGIRLSVGSIGTPAQPAVV